jgi:hypothetical protein
MDYIGRACRHVHSRPGNADARHLWCIIDSTENVDTYGETVIPHSRPYQLLLVGFFPNGTAKQYCGASLVKSTHVLTAAHCVFGDNAGDVHIYPGLHFFPSGVLSKDDGIPARQIFVHESYAPQGLNNDVAVIRLQREVEIDSKTVGLICLPDKSTDPCRPGDDVVGKTEC